MKAEIGEGAWNESEEGWLKPSVKPKEKQSTIGTHEAVVYCPMIDWKIKKTGFHYMWDVCDTLVVSRPWNVCLQ